MAKKADISSKRLVGLDPDGWVQWVAQRDDIAVLELLDSQFQWISREGDVLVKASSPQHGKFLVLNELQFRHDPRSPKRLRAYAALAEEKYDLPVYPVLINILPPSPGTTIATRYESNFMGLRARQDYRVINLWEVDVEVAFEPSRTTLLPFAPVMKGGNTESVVRRAAQILQENDEFRELENVLALFASYVLNPSLVQQLVRFDMTVLRESPLVLMFQQEEALRILERQLRRRFGEAPEPIIARLQLLSVEEIEQLIDEAVTVNSLDEFIASLPQADNNES